MGGTTRIGSLLGNGKAKCTTHHYSTTKLKLVKFSFHVPLLETRYYYNMQKFPNPTPLLTENTGIFDFQPGLRILGFYYHIGL